MAARLAGGFARPASGAELRAGVGEALDTLPLGDLAPLAGLPGMVKATLRTLRAAWDAGYDLSARPECARHRDLAAIERLVAETLPPDALLPNALIRRALARTPHARSVLGDVSLEGVFEVGAGWRPLLAEIARCTAVKWHVPEGDPCTRDWEHGATLLETAPGTPAWEGTRCANPKHEVWEALRWARELVAEGRALPGEIFIAAPNAAEAAAYFETACEETDLRVALTAGYNALSTRAGRQASALAALLHDGLSRAGVVRLVDACRGQILQELPGSWARAYPDQAPYRTLGQWRRAMRAASQKGWPGGVDQQPLLEPVLLAILEAADVAGARRAGQAALPGPALALWEHALSHRNLRGLPGVLGEIHVQSDLAADVGACVAVGSIEEFATWPRPHVRVIGLTGSGFPRQDRQDPLLPDHLLQGRPLRAWTRTDLDRRAWRRLAAPGVEHVHLSRPHHDAQGRPQRPSALWPADLEPVRARVVAPPICPLGEADRLFGRIGEFTESELGASAGSCWGAWWSREATAHDGLDGPHPALAAGVERHHSATSLALLMRDPLGFVWRYVLGIRVDPVDERPIRLEPRDFGTLVHAILDRAVTDGCTEDQAADQVADEWRASGICPPRAIWEMQVDQALEHARQAVKAMDLPPGVEQWGEVHFGFDEPDPEARAPWPTNAELRLGEARLRGKIDHLAFDPRTSEAWVTDFKTGKSKVAPECVLGGCAELQRCLYAVAVRRLMPAARAIEARLLYTLDGTCVPLPEPDEAAIRLEAHVRTALDHLRAGRVVPGPGATDRYNDFKFALPPNAEGLYLVRKEAAFAAANAALEALWEEA